jgi:UDP-N-acetyl-D-glucosamine dehydrogenase
MGKDIDVNQLKQRIESHEALVVVVGLGYVGLPFAVEKAKIGFSVIGIEQNFSRLEKINRGENYISDVKDEELKDLVSRRKIQAVPDFDCVSRADVVVICVPTPLTQNLTPELSYIESVTRSISQYLRPNTLISLESTTYPGTTDEVVKTILEKSGEFQQGRDFFLAHSPERVDPGNKRYTTKNTSKVVGASDSKSLEIALFFYKQTIQDVVPVSSAKAAEMVKVFENTFRAVNIALANELALLCDRMNLNVWEVLDAANTKPFGIMPFYPGPGVGGHCIPIDPHYLEWKAKEYNFETHFIALAGEVNRRMPGFVREKAWRLLNKVGIAASKSQILVMGVAYKKDLGDWRESPSVKVIEYLLEDGASVSYYDPFVPKVEIAGRQFSSVLLTDQLIENADIVLILVDHTGIDYEYLVNKARAILDTRGVTRALKCNLDKVELL